jgi:hypothetical protein
MLINWQHYNKDGIGCKFLFEARMLLEQCTNLGYLLLEAPREYVQHGPLLSINRLWLCPQSGARVRSHAIRRRLFIVLMTAAHISPNVFSLWNFLNNIHVLLFIIHSPSFILVIHHIQASNYILLLHDNFTLSFLRLFIAGRLPSVPCVWYKSNLCIVTWLWGVRLCSVIFNNHRKTTLSLNLLSLTYSMAKCYMAMLTNPPPMDLGLGTNLPRRGCPAPALLEDNPLSWAQYGENLLVCYSHD